MTTDTEVRHANLHIRRAIAGIARLLSPGYGGCQRCSLPWSVVEGHTTMFTEQRGCSPLCRKCWMDLSPDERVPFYRELWNDWEAMGATLEAAEWDQIERAVRAGR